MMADILAAIRPTANDPGFTSWEIARAQGVDEQTARRQLQQAVARGEMLVGKAYRPRSDGRPFVQIVYRPA